MLSLAALPLLLGETEIQAVERGRCAYASANPLARTLNMLCMVAIPCCSSNAPCQKQEELVLQKL